MTMTLAAYERTKLSKADARVADPTVATCAECGWWKKNLHPGRVDTAAVRHKTACKGTR